ncbi:SulP family inorganic anion transporter [Gemmata sp. JC717]|uniref:bifunctional SulP family inorganic anion transporter/carbonic anhydrase n=1 Tax=Gemmata algarum TaxID=2975278 RepID=UPI0021BB9284|nr:SulP family inorganic anion transporter [Gemmata algarum]MDY3553787.1 SulP family inorganic anion transporter [Gemmata algarum]
MPTEDNAKSGNLLPDLGAGLVVFLVALPLCLGVALASNAPLFSGLLAGVVGGLVVGFLSGSHTSVSGPAAGLTAVAAAQITALGSFQAFLLAVVVAGLIQIVLGLARAGFVAAFFPTAVIKGLLAAIGVILVLKQIPHVVGHDPDPDGDMAFQQPDHQNTFTELIHTVEDVHPGAATVGLLSIVMLVLWERSRLARLPVPAPLVVVLFGVGLSQLFRQLGREWLIECGHLVQVPVADSVAGFLGFLQLPDFEQLSNPAVYMAGLTIAAAASIQSLVTLEAVDRTDPQRRASPASRELLAQGCGNVLLGFLGGLPIVTEIVRGTVNVKAGGRTKWAAVVHGALLLGCVALLPTLLNLIPLSCLAAILLVTGVKLASPRLVRSMWVQGWPQFAPFILTVAAIVLTDPLIGVLIGLAASVVFILRSSVRWPLRLIVERHLSESVTRIALPSQVSFLNRAVLARSLDEIPRGGHVLLDAEHTDYIDPDILGLIREFTEQTAPARGVEVSLRGFRSEYRLSDQIQYVDYSTRDVQEAMTPEQVLQLLRDGNERFRAGRQLTRDLGRQVRGTAGGQHPLAVVLSCIDSRTPAELVFDLGVGDVFSVRLAGNVASRKVLGSIEYGCAVAGAKLVLVMGHTRCGAVTAAVDLICSGRTAAEVTGCQHLDHIIGDVQRVVDPVACRAAHWPTPADKEAFVNDVARRNVLRVVASVVEQSETLRRLVREGRIAVAGAMYDVNTGEMEFLTAGAADPAPAQSDQ